MKSKIFSIVITLLLSVMGISAQITITAASLPDGTVGVSYYQTLTATGASGVSWSISAGTLPDGLNLTTTGIIFGTPTTAGTSNFTVRAVYGAFNDSKSFSITVAQTWDISATAADNVTATFSGGTLTISGTGNMQNYSATNVQWYSVANSISSLVIDSGITNIGSYAFYTCSNITVFSGIPSTVTSIGDGAFSFCYALTSITIPNSVTSIGSDAFKGCSALTAINVDAANLNYSSDDGVLYNKNKTTLMCYPAGKSGAYAIPNSVTSIVSNAIYNCGVLTSLTIPASVTSIGSYALYCYNLTSITCLNSNPPALGGSGVFFGVDKNNCVLNVPSGSVSLYQSADQWRDFTQIKGVSTGIENIELQNIKLYPNPVKDYFFITAESPINKLEIYGQDGKMVIQENNFAEKMDVSSLAKGLYVVKVYTVQGIATVKIIKN